MAGYDMHVHSSNSDGLLTPQEVVAAAAGAVDGLCFTDHSGVTYDDDLTAAARRAGVELLFPGIEISTMHDGNKYHVLGYGKGLLHQDFRAFAFHPTRVKNRVYAELVDELRRTGTQVPDVETMLTGPTPGGGPHHPTKWMLSKTIIASHLVANGMAAEDAKAVLRERYDDIARRHPDRYLPTLDTIRKVREFGGFPVIAHPWWECPSGLNTPERLRTALSSFRSAGLLGLEVSTRHQTVGTEAFRRSVADDTGLLPFLGSDFHANGKTELGQFTVSEAELTEIRLTAASHGCTL